MCGCVCLLGCRFSSLVLFTLRGLLSTPNVLTVPAVPFCSICSIRSFFCTLIGLGIWLLVGTHCNSVLQKC